jgi:multidrug resistance efflux pump
MTKPVTPAPAQPAQTRTIVVTPVQRKTAAPPHPEVTAAPSAAGATPAAAASPAATPRQASAPAVHVEVQAMSGQANMTLTPQPSRPVESKASHGLELLLKIEAEARKAASVKELGFLIANETVKLTRARQVFVTAGSAPTPQAVTTISAVSHLDAKSARVRWIEAILKALAADTGLGKNREFSLPAYTPTGDTEHQTYPFPNFLWLPFRLVDGTVFGGMLLSRDTPWAEGDALVADRLAGTYAHAWAALEGQGRLRRRHRFRLRYAVMAAGLVALAGFIPVPMTVLAPMDVAAVNANVLAAPMDGIVEAVLVDPNTPVKAGDAVVRLSDTALRNDQAVARQELAVADARLKQVMQGAISDDRMLREIAIARAEVAVKQARLAYAEDMLKRTVITAPNDGVAVYTDRRDWQGRPVQTGEKIIEIADPSELELRIFVAVKDSIAVREGSTVRAFLDSDPVNPVDAVVKSASYEARQHDNGVLAYQVLAQIPAAKANAIRLGVHGTAQVAADHVPLAFWLFRRPFTAMRQWSGL